MANNKVGTPKDTNPTPVLPERIHFRQFLAMHPGLDEMQQSGFKAFCGVKEWMRESEWSQKLESYKNNK